MAESCTLKVLGLVSGESADGVDAALAEIEEAGPGAQVRLVAYRRYPYQSKVRKAALDVTDPETSRVDVLASLSFVLGELLAAAAIDLVKQAGLSMSDIDLIGSAGHRVHHQPGQLEVGGMWTISTLEIGEPSVIAERTGVTVVSDFRAADMAVGGQGAPIAAYADHVLFGSPNRRRAVQHIGDIGSVTYLPPGGRLDEVIAFDTGPGNALIDMIVSKLTSGNLTYDAGGALAAAGRPDRHLLSRLMDHPFVQKHPPKSTRLGEFGSKLADTLVKAHGEPMEDLVATVTAFVVQSIARSHRRWFPKPPDDMIVGGRGARNPTLMGRLAEALPGVNLMAFEDFDIDGEAGEALSAAILANETIHLRPRNVPSATGARHAVILGKIVPGRSFEALMARLQA